jgi:hypothetical protein
MRNGIIACCHTVAWLALGPISQQNSSSFFGLAQKRAEAREL